MARAAPVIARKLARGDTARLTAWLVLAGRDPLDTGAAQARWPAITAAAHASRPGSPAARARSRRAK